MNRPQNAGLAPCVCYGGVLDSRRRGLHAPGLLEDKRPPRPLCVECRSGSSYTNNQQHSRVTMKLCLVQSRIHV